jgi:hypothetical protein
LQMLFAEIAAAMSGHNQESAQRFVQLLALLLDSLSLEKTRFGALISQTFRDPALVHSTATEVGYLRIAAALLSMADTQLSALDLTLRAPRLVYDSPPPPTLPPSNDWALSPASSSVRPPKFLDDRVLGKLRYRWMATTFTPEGLKARRSWMGNFRPPDLEHDEFWLSLPAFRELCRHVLGLLQVEITEDDIEFFFDYLDVENSGRASFYKLVGILEADPTRDYRAAGTGLRFGKRRPKARVSFEGPPWRPPGRDSASRIGPSS